MPNNHIHTRLPSSDDGNLADSLPTLPSFFCTSAGAQKQFYINADTMTSMSLEEAERIIVACNGYVLHLFYH